ncbi:LacI family DNA-binding transcriptional regulator [Saccharopolyspora hirsuta]|uniref:LacI family transcriptional regulator n=1 Tax=Saccharopolyspora hirsuta TaxID=1837 RepID=A0A5M7CBW1_SACHI|nr:LacI family DNA-binding transcriptional regulator [Saccharopolyspora hirsuta]KAA5837917.1 LacI family transcriptional regulator [Saccharopolyspora hirsuta]
MAKKPTLRDVSRATGLSTYTVSRALNDGDDVAPGTRELVRAAARELGYVPNRVAQELRKNTRSSIAVITASTSNYYYIEMMKGVQRVLRSTGRTAFVADIAAEGLYSAEVEDATVRQLIQSRTAGVIATLTLSPANTRLLDDWDIPVVFVDSAPPAEAANVPHIGTDNVAASTQVGAHLAEHGYRDWLFLAYPSRWSTRVDRERGLQEAAHRHGARLEVVESDNDAESARCTLEKYLDERAGALPQAIVAGNNPMLHGVLRCLRTRGARVPADVGLVAFDEFPWAPLLDPPLTVLNENSEEIGELAAQTLTRVIDQQLAAEREGQQPRPRYTAQDRREVPAELVIRESCGCPAP